MTTIDLAGFGQQHLVRFMDELSPEDAESLRGQIAQIDFDELAALTKSAEQAVDWGELAARADSPPAVRLGQPHPEFSTAEAVKAGEQAIRSGQVGVILVAGGQGTRLGFDKPKGMFPIAPISHRTLFQMHCDRLLAVMRRYDVSIPLLVMTSPATDALTRAYFDENDRCGLAEDQLCIFSQGTMPAVDEKSGKLLLAAKNQLALSPDGHGGLVAALEKHGCLARAKQDGIDYFYYAQVDNPLAQLCDPELIGYHVLSKSQVTTQVVKKRFATEKVGNVVSVDGKVQIIEYSDLPQAAAEQTQPDGSLKLWAGNIAVHVFDRSFLDGIVRESVGLPFHRAHKKVAYINEAGLLIEPEAPNAIKFERFVFDLLPLADRAIVVEGDPAKVFAPVKNADGGAVDTPAHSQAAMLALHRSWLQAAGAKIPEGVQVEIHPAWALDAEEVAAKLPANIKFEADTFLR